MRIDGSIKSLITGVSTVDKSRSKDVKYMRECLNFRNDTVDGLSRRPPSELVKNVLEYDDLGVTYTLDDFDIEADVMKSFEVDGDKYWFYSKSNPTNRDHVVQVYDEDGNRINTTRYEGTYLKGTLGNDSIRLASSGDVTYVVNTEIEVKSIAGSQPIEDNHSMFVVRNAPKVYSKIVLRWENPDYTQSAMEYEIGEDHITQPIPDINDVDTGVNTTTELIAAKIRAVIIADGNASDLEIDQEGATIVFRNISTTYPRKYSRVTVEDGTGGSVLAINGTVQDVAELPRYSHPNALVEVKPDPTSNRGKFYMKSAPVLTAVAPNPLPTPVTVMVAGDAGDAGSEVRGYSIWIPAFGSVTVTDPIPGYPGHDIFGLLSITDKPFNESNTTTFQISVTKAPAGESIPPEALQYMEFWDTTLAVPVRVAQVNMYQNSAIPDTGGSSWHSWEGVIDTGFRFINGRSYSVYFEDVVETYTTVPEVRWEEESAPNQDTVINADTFPHVLYRATDGTFKFGSMNAVSADAVPSMRPRASGDDITNPMPAVVGNKIKDVAVFQNRLALLTADKVSMSVTGQPNDWFRGTVVQLLATSPISIQSSSAGAVSLTHFVEHNNDLMVFGPSGQFRFSGRLGITPSNASLPQASTYQADTLAVPVAAGNDVFFATSYGESAGISQFSLDPQIDNLSIAKPLADLQVGLIPGSIQQIIATPNLGLILARVDGNRNELYALEFEPQIDILKPIIPTWSKWNFSWGMRIISMRIANDVIEFAAVGDSGRADAGQVRLYRMQLFGDRRISTEVAYPWSDVHLDARVREAGVNSTINVSAHYPPDLNPLFPLVVVQGGNSPNPGARVEYTYDPFLRIITLAEDMLGGDVYYGYVYVSLIRLPDFDVSDASGIIQTRSSLRITDLDLTLTGHVSVLIEPKYGDVYPYQHYVGKGSEGGSELGYVRDRYRVQVKQDSDNIKNLSIVAFNQVGLNIHQIEYRGTYNKVGRRL
jgi:hypothetical protein